MLRILLIDDNPKDRLIATRELKQAFHDLEIRSIADAQALEQALAEGGFDLVVTDYRLLWSDGLKVLKAVKAQYPDCPVVMFTDSGSEEVAVEGMKAGLSDYVLKGRQVYRLSIAVQESLEKQKLRHQYAVTVEKLQTSEETLRFALEAGKAIAYSWDIKTGAIYRFDYISGKATEDFDRATPTTFEQTLEAIHPEDRQHFQTCIKAALNGSPYEAEFRVMQPDGSSLWVYDRGKVQVDGSNQPIRLIGVATDISGRKQLEEKQVRLLELEQTARTAAEEANRVKDEFLATLSHELRSPLNAILGWCQLLRSRKLNEATVASAMETIERNAKLQAQLVEDLLDISRIIRGKLRLNITPLNLVAPLAAAIETMRPAAEAKTIQIQSLLSHDVGMILGDASRLQQVFWNLLSNAIKFTPAGGQVEVRLERYESSVPSVPVPSVIDAELSDLTQNSKGSSTSAHTASGSQEWSLSAGVKTAHPLQSYAQITVSDTGQGITPEFLPYLFDSFRQADASTTRNHNGLGLGLAIVRHLLELHGGTVIATSPGEGLGATFAVRLPLLPQKQGQVIENVEKSEAKLIWPLQP